MFTDLFDNIYQAIIYADRWMKYFSGLGITLLLSLGAIVLGVIIGILVALVKYNNKKFGTFKILNKVCDFYLTIFRGTPVYVQLLIMYFVVFTRLEVLWTAIITFGINSGAYVAEIIRAGFEGVDDGQVEAGCSLGLSKTQVMISIVLPQAVRLALPPLCNEFIALIKETAIVGTIGVIDVTKAGERIANKMYEVFVPYIFTALLYLAVVLILTKLLKLLEKKLAKSDRM